MSIDVGILDDAFLPLLEVPATARRGEPFIVKVTTAGGGCRDGHSTEVAVMQDAAIVTPYDRYTIPHGSSVCTLGLRPILHEATVQFDVPGLKVVHIRGRDTSASKTADVNIERQVTVE